MKKIDKNRKEKACVTCLVVKPIDGYTINSQRPDGHASVCKECFHAMANSYTKEHYKEIEQTRKAYKEDLRRRHDTGELETVLHKVCGRCRVDKNSDLFHKNLASKTGLSSLCKACTKIQAKEYRDTHKDEVRERNRKYRKDNRAKVNEYCNKHITERRNTNAEFRVATNLRARVRMAVKDFSRGKAKKAAKTFDLVGCDISIYCAYLLSQAYPNPETGEEMTLDNCGETGWEMDHIIPIDVFNLLLPEEQYKAFNVSNVQPLWVKDHKKKHNEYGFVAPPGVTLESLMAKYLKWKEEYDKSSKG